MPQKILQSPDFLKALSFAKDALTAANLEQISISALLLGFLHCERIGCFSNEYPVLKENLCEMQRISDSTGLCLSAEFSEPKSPQTLKMSLSKELKEILNSSKDMATLVVNLVDSVVNKKGPGAALEKLVEAIQSENGFDVSNQYAHQIAHRHDLKTISAEALTAGAYIALKKGELGVRPAISSHLQSSRKVLDILFEKHGWNSSISDYNPNINGVANFPLGPWVSDLIHATTKGANPFAASINLGIRGANKIVMQRRVAYHEAGHAVLTSILQPNKTISKITVLDEENEEGADGYVAYDLSAPYFDTPTSREDVLQNLCIALAGRVAEQRQYGHDEIDAGATSDLADATKQAWKAITEFGLDFEFGPVNLVVLRDEGKQSHGWLFDEAQRRLQSMMKEALLTTETLVDTHWEKIEAVAKVLIEKKVLTEDDMVRVMRDQNAAGIHKTTVI